MRRTLLATLVLAGCSSNAPRLLSFAGRTVPRGERSISLDMRVGDRLLVEMDTTKPLGRDVWAWTLDAPPGWNVDPQTRAGRWEVLPGTPHEVVMSLLLATGRDGRGPSSLYSIVATVSDPDDTDAPTDDTDSPPDDTDAPPSDTDGTVESSPTSR